MKDSNYPPAPSLDDEIEVVGWMRASPGSDDYSMLINERPDGGFEWRFLDFKPESLPGIYKPIYISLRSRKGMVPAAEVERLQKLACSYGESISELALKERVAEAVKAERERCIALCETTIMGGKAREFLEPKQ